MGFVRFVAMFTNQMTLPEQRKVIDNLFNNPYIRLLLSHFRFTL
jgi:hypothetical protein